jgi:hypothetical protein
MTKPATSPPLTARMTMRTVPPLRGAAWVRLGFAAFIKHPLVFSGLFGLLCMSLLFLVQLPWIGGVVFLANLPWVTLAFMLTSQHIAAQRPVSLKLYFAPLRLDRKRTRSLLLLGLFYAAVTLAILAFCHWWDSGKFVALQTALQQQTITADELQNLLNDPELQYGVFLCLGLLTLRTLLFWHAPALIYWADHSTVQALFFNAIALWRSKAAFAVYALVAAALLVGLQWLSWLMVALLGQPSLAATLVIFAAIIFTCVFYASIFFSFADSFEPAGPY